MPKLLTPRMLLRGLELFLLASLISYLALIFYSKNVNAFLSAIPKVRWGWAIIGLGLASLDWIGGGLKNYVLARNIVADPPLKGMIMSGGMSAWAAYLTPIQSGAAP